MNVTIPARDVVELAIHRALRSEFSPFIRAVTADISDGSAVMHVYHHKPDTEEWPATFGETIESEWEQVFPRGVLSKLPLLRIVFHDAEKFSTPFEESQRIIYVNDWSPRA